MPWSGRGIYLGVAAVATARVMLFLRPLRTPLLNAELLVSYMPLAPKNWRPSESRADWFSTESACCICFARIRAGQAQKFTHRQQLPSPAAWQRYKCSAAGRTKSKMKTRRRPASPRPHAAATRRQRALAAARRRRRRDAACEVELAHGVFTGNDRELRRRRQRPPRHRRDACSTA